MLKRVGETRKLLEDIKRRKKTWIGHLLRRDGLMKEVLEGRMRSKRTVGRRRQQLLDDMLQMATRQSRNRRRIGRNGGCGSHRVNLQSPNDSAEHYMMMMMIPIAYIMEELGLYNRILQYSYVILATDTII